eukprot:117515-Chlamydomonas_euryale.AAC.1
MRHSCKNGSGGARDAARVTVPTLGQLPRRQHHRCASACMDTKEDVACDAARAHPRSGLGGLRAMQRVLMRALMWEGRVHERLRTMQRALMRALMWERRVRTPPGHARRQACATLHAALTLGTRPCSAPPAASATLACVPHLRGSGWHEGVCGMKGRGA